MAILLKQSTAVDVLIGPFVDDTDGKTAEVSLTMAAAAVLLSKNGQALTLKSDATAGVYDANGCYNCEFDATDTNTLGSLVLTVFETGALPVRHEYMVVPGWYYDLNVSGLGIESGTLQAVTSGSAFRLHSGAVGVNDDLNGSIVVILSGTGAGQSPRTIVDSVAADDSVIVDPAFTTAPSTDTVVLVMPAPPAVNTATYAPRVDTIAISGDTTAADNAELFFDGTGYSASNSGVGSVGTVSSLDGHTAQTGDSYALLATDTIAEMAQGVPPATPTFREAIMYLYMRLRNKLTVTTSELAIYNDAGTKIAKKAVTDDGTTYTEAEMISGA